MFKNKLLVTGALALILLVMPITGCQKKSLGFPGEDNIQAYVQKVLELGELPSFDYSPSIEDFFLTAFKAKLVQSDFEYLKPAISETGLLADSECTIYFPIGWLSAICDGKTRLYIDDELICEFNSEDKAGRAYSLLSEQLAKRIGDYISNPGWFPDSIQGKRIYVNFYMAEEDWVNAIADKDPFKYLCLDVFIKDPE